MNKPGRKSSGQMAIVAVLLLVALLISVTVVVFLNQTQNQFGVGNQKRQKAHAIMHEGVDYAVQVLASSGTWAAALNGTFPQEFYDASSSTGLRFYDPAGTKNYYTILCSTGVPGTTKYEVTVLVTGYTSIQGNNLTPTRALLVTVSQKTMSATLPTGINASAALELLHVPAGGASVNVHWGPILVQDSVTDWTLNGPIDAGQYPRKFAQQGIRGASPNPRTANSTPQNSDNQEYWAFTSAGYVPGIDVTSYQAAAKNTALTNPPYLHSTCTSCSPGPCTCTAMTHQAGDCQAPGPANCAYFTVPAGDTADFGEPSSHTQYALTQPGAVIYINGNANFFATAIDLKGDTSASVFPSSGALIVTGTAGNGNLTIGNPGAGMSLTNARIPPSVSLEYPYYPAHPTTYPCAGSSGSCAASAMQFRGFLYVGGNLIDNTSSMNMIGALRVDGVLTFNNEQLNLTYDDEINHSILVDHFELQVDSMQDVTPR